MSGQPNHFAEPICRRRRRRFSRRAMLDMRCRLRRAWSAIGTAAGACGVCLLSSFFAGCSSNDRQDGAAPQAPAEPGAAAEPDELSAPDAQPPDAPAEAGSAPAAPAQSDDAERQRERRRKMVQEQLRARGITDERVLQTLARVARHEFVPPEYLDLAYADQPLPIDAGQTISQPYIVGLMTELARPRPGARALDVGTGSGYQAAVLAELVGEVYSIEIVRALADQARRRLRRLAYKNVEIRCGDGYQGWPERAPFDLIIVAAAPDHIPQPLVEQLARGGRLIIPVGRFFQELVVVEKQPDGSVRQWNVASVAFVPMVGKAQQGPAAKPAAP